MDSGLLKIWKTGMGRKKMKQNLIWLHCLLTGVFLILALTSTVYAGCRVSTTSIDFGNYDVFSTAADTGTGSITLSCTPQANVRIAIEASLNSGGFSPRKMDHAVFTDTLNYNLYTSAPMIQVWGDGTHGTATVYFSNVKNNNTPPVTIYGKIDPLQNVSAGSYSEQLIVTITY
jgi:spore coat protein U-like protein